MKIRHLLALAAATTAVASASAFEWNPAILQPNQSLDVTEAYQLETLRFATNQMGAYTPTDVMPVWIDEDGNEVIGSLSDATDPTWDEYVYNFNIASFSGNGEYILKFPEGLLKNAAGELSDAKEYYYTVNVAALAGAMFDDFEILSISPDFSEAQALWNDQVITINTNHNDAIGVVTLQVIDNTTGESYINSSNFSTGRGLGNSNEIVWEVANSYKFYEGHEYVAEFIFYNGDNEYSQEGVPTPIVARKSYTFTGKVEGYQYSDLTLLSVEPAPGTLTISEPSQAVFTYTFSGPVTVYQASTPRGNLGTVVYPESCLSANEDNTVWTLNLSDNEDIKNVDSAFTINIYARDMDGYQLKGNFGEESESCFSYEWQCDLGAVSIVVVSPENGESLDRLTEIVVKSENGEPMSWSWVGQAEIQNLLGESLGTLVYNQTEGEEEAAATEFHFTQIMDDNWNVAPIDIVKEGSYVIYFGAGCFMFGDQFESKASKSVYSGFQITGAADETPDDPGIDPAEQETLVLTEATPASGSTVESLETIRLTFPEAVGLNGGDVTVYDANNEVVATGYCDLDWEDFDAVNVAIVKLNNPITADGVYEVVIPARSIISENYEEGVAGICNPEIRLTYTVGGAVADGLQYVSVTPENESTVKVLEQIVLTFGEPVICDDFEIEVCSAARAVVTTAKVRGDYMDPTLVVVDLAEPIKEDGRYYMVIPSGKLVNAEYYESNGAAGLTNPDYTLIYSVEDGGSDQPGVDPSEQETFNYTEVSPASGSTVNSLDVINMWFPATPYFWGFDAYLYKADAIDADPVATAFVMFDYYDDYLAYATFKEPVTEDGEYVFVIPARSIGDEKFLESDGDEGICNPEIRLYYTVKNDGSGVASVNGSAKCDVYDIQGRRILHNASAADLKTLSKGIYVVGSKKLVVK